MKSKLQCVLLIDDDSLVNKMNKFLIDNQHWLNNTIVRESAIAGLFYLNKSAAIDSNFPFPDLILLDIDMPEINGLDFMSFFDKMKSSFPSLPVIYLLTSYHFGKYVSEGASTKDIEGVLQKPLTDEMLQTIFQKHFIVR